MPARFRVLDVYLITGRGVVIARDIIEGSVRAGMITRVPPLPTLTLSSVEYVDRIPEHGSKLGLVVSETVDPDALRDILRPGIEIDLEDPQGVSVRDTRLRRYWFPMMPGLGIGVTESSEQAARRLAEETRRAYFPSSSLLPPVPDIDVSTLDPKHVLPNVGPSALRGVWFPMLNL